MRGHPDRFGDPGVSPAALRAFLGELASRLLELVPEDDRAAAAEQLLQEIEGMKLKAKPAQPGESIVFGEAATQLMNEAARRALDEMLRSPRTEADDG